MGERDILSVSLSVYAALSVSVGSDSRIGSNGRNAKGSFAVEALSAGSFAVEVLSVAVYSEYPADSWVTVGLVVILRAVSVSGVEMGSRTVSIMGFSATESAVAVVSGEAPTVLSGLIV